MIEVHDGTTNVDAGYKCNQIEEKQRGQGIENHLCSVKMHQGSVAQKCNVHVIERGDKPERIAKEARKKPFLTY